MEPEDDSLIPKEDIFQGGLLKNGIPSLDIPKFVKANEATILTDGDRVLALKRNGIAKASPFVELAKSFGEVDDTLAGQTIQIRYSHDHQSAEVFDATGKPLPGVTLFWFAWYAFYPGTEVWRDE